MATFTASLQFAPNLKTNHTGIQAMGSRTSICATGTASSVLLLGNVPNQATLLDWWAYIDGAGGNQVVQIGTSATPSGIAAALSLSAVAAAAVGAGGFRAPHGDLLPARISLSDDVQPLQVMTQAKFGTAISASMLFTFMLFYTNDGMRGIATIR